MSKVIFKRASKFKTADPSLFLTMKHRHKHNRRLRLLKDFKYEQGKEHNISAHNA